MLLVVTYEMCKAVMRIVKEVCSCAFFYCFFFDLTQSYFSLFIDEWGIS